MTNAILVIKPRRRAIEATAARGNLDVVKLLSVLDVLCDHPQDAHTNALALSCFNVWRRNTPEAPGMIPMSKLDEAIAVGDLSREDLAIDDLVLHDAAQTYLAAKQRAEQADRLAQSLCDGFNRFDDYPRLSDAAKRALSRYTICAAAAQLALEDYRLKQPEWENRRPAANDAIATAITRAAANGGRV